MAYQLPFTGDTIKKIASYRATPPAQDLVDGVYTDASPRAITSGVEYKLIFDSGNLAREFSNGFSDNTGITTMWNFTDNVTSYSELLDTPTMVALPNCYFQPSSANAGDCIIRMYVNETSPILMDQAIVGYKGTTYEKMGDLFSYYLGDEAGFQVKTKGVYFTFEFEHNGNMKDMGIFHYLT